jgi:hypothetical protein
MQLRKTFAWGGRGLFEIVMTKFDKRNSLLKQGTKQYNGVRGGAVGWGTAVQTGRSRVRFQMESPEFFSDLILPVALWLWGRLSL